MREGEAGFTLVELVVVVAIVAIMVAGSLWLFGVHPGALRGAVDGFDQRYAEARSLAATSGNGATIVFAPRSSGPGFVMSVYAGRPSGANAVAATNTMRVVSDADISEATLGSPPFAIFLSSAGMASGSAHYPSIDAQGNVSFPMITKQPPCPSAGGFTLTFSVPRATDSRTLSCAGVMAFGTAAPQPTLTPEQLRIDTPLMLAHWTSDAGPLHFKAGEFGYAHWFASAEASQDCSNATSDRGGAPAQFLANYPYAHASAAEMALAPAPPLNTPYTWAAQETGHPPDQPPGAFALSPVAGNGGTCTARIMDDHGQEVDSAIQVMGDLTPQNLTAPYAIDVKVGDPSQTVIVGKTFDTEALQLQFGGKCGGIVSVVQTGHAEPASVSAQATTATFTVAPVAAGSCVLEVTDQYGEPHVLITINVSNPRLMVIPQYIEYPLPPATTIAYPTGITVGYRGMDSVDVRVAKWLNAMFGGGVANAGAGPAVGTPCNAINFLDAAYTVADGSDDSIFGTQGGCYVQGTTIPGLTAGSVSAVEALGYNGEAFSYNTYTCSRVLVYPGWTNSGNGPAALLGESVNQDTTSTSCTFYVGDQANRTPPLPVQAKLVGCSYDPVTGTGIGSVDVGGACTVSSLFAVGDFCGDGGTANGAFDYYWASFNPTPPPVWDPTDTNHTNTDLPGDFGNGTHTWSETEPFGTISNNEQADRDLVRNEIGGLTSFTFTRAAPGAVTLYVFRAHWSEYWTRPFGGANPECHINGVVTGPGTLTIN